MKRPITREFYEALLQAFREQPGNIRAAAAKAGCDARLAKKAWELGIAWAIEATGARKPIKDTIAEEQTIARARLEEQEAAKRQLTIEQEAQRLADLKQKASADATDSRVQEGKVVRMARGSAANLLVTLTNMTMGVAKLGPQIKATLERFTTIDPDTGNPRDMSLSDCRQMIQLLNGLTNMLRSANDAARSAMEMERLLLGEPGAYVGVVNYDAMTLEEAERRVLHAQRAFARARELGVIIGSAPALDADADADASAGDGPDAPGKLN